MDLGLKGKSVLVTGGTRGIGKAIVRAFAAEGARVAFTFRSSADEAARYADELRAAGTEVLYFQGDASEPASAEEAVNAVVKAWGSLDVLVNNAGITKDNLLLRMTPDDWDAVIHTNLKSVFNFSKAAYRPMMKQRSGRIITLSSVVGVMGNAGQTNYAASKAGIIGFTKSLAKELAARGITVNVVAPGYIESDMTAALPEAAREAMLGTVPMNRPGMPEDVAGAVLFLASDMASYVTGQTLQVNGGMAM